ncbi:MAG: acyl carrier protein [Candidatus Sericytochromatia bacterium]|nr:acyl carrier protein [Candidatus Sericytochromatia bacterium]
MDRLNASETLQWLQQEVASLLDLPAEQVSLERPLAEQGLDSADAVGLSGQLEERLNTELDPTLVFEYPSLQQLVDYLVSVGFLTESA